MKNTKLFIFAAAALLAAVSFVITKAEKSYPRDLRKVSRS